MADAHPHLRQVCVSDGLLLPLLGLGVWERPGTREEVAFQLRDQLEALLPPRPALKRPIFRHRFDHFFQRVGEGRVRRLDEVGPLLPTHCSDVEAWRAVACLGRGSRLGQGEQTLCRQLSAHHPVSFLQVSLVFGRPRPDPQLGECRGRPGVVEPGHAAGLSHWPGVYDRSAVSLSPQV